MSRLLAGLSRLPKPWTIFFAVVLAALVGGLDYITGYELEVSSFFLVPICWACWAMGRKAGLLLAAVSVGFALAADVTSGHAYAHPAIPYWNALMLLGVFAVAVYSFTAFLVAYRSLAEAQSLLRNANERLEETVQQRTAALRAEIAERERAEKAKLHAERLLEKQAKLASLGTLAAGIAHEIRNPLTSVKARLYTLDKHLEAPSLARKDAEIISTEVARLENIVQSVLNFARPSEPELKTICAQDLLREVHSLMASTLDDRRMQFTVEPGPDQFISADTSHLKQVLINLVRNAVEAIETEGTITLRARRSRATLEERDTEAVILEVADTGRGIPPEVEKRLFDPFFTTKETGTGLGLSIAARIVEKHGGVLQYQTRVGHGTTFGIVLPLLGSQASGKKLDASTNA